MCTAAASGGQYHLSVVRGEDTIEFDTPGKVTGYPLYRDEVVVMRSSGGGGYGDPLERDAELVRRDVAGGYVSAERAASGYGVVLDARGAVDASATTARRAAMRQLGFRLRVVADDAIDAYVGAKGRRRIVRLAAQDAATLGAQEDDLVELLGANPAPLRALGANWRGEGGGSAARRVCPPRAAVRAWRDGATAPAVHAAVAKRDGGLKRFHAQPW